AGMAYADRIAVVDGDVSYTWRDFRSRSRRFASALRAKGLRRDDRIAFLALNSEPLLLAHFAIPQAGGVLVAINTRWSADEVCYVIEHSGAAVVFHTPELKALLSKVPGGVHQLDTHRDFEEFLATGADEVVESWLTKEEDSVAIDYTSGTTG